MTENPQGDRVRLSLTRTRWQTVRFHLTSPVVVVTAACAIAASVAAPVVAGATGPSAQTSSVETPVMVPTTSRAATRPPDGGEGVESADTEPETTSTPQVSVTLALGPLAPIMLTAPHGATVEALLSDRGIEPGPDDIVSPGPGHVLADGDRVVVTQIRFQTSTEDTVIPQPASRTVDDPDLPKGTSTVAQQGRPGVERVHYRVKVTDGVPGEPEVVSRETVTEPLATITKIGTRVQPSTGQALPTRTVTQSAPAPRSSAQPAPSTPIVVAQERVVTIRCETAATVQVTVTGPDDVSLALEPGGSWTGKTKIIGNAVLTGPGSVTATFTGTFYSVSALGGVCR